VFKRRSFLAAVIDDALADNEPFRNLVEQYFTESMMREIATEYARGRVLLIATTNLDARRAVIWDIGAIASSGHPRSLELVRSVLVASAAVPGVFPPVMIDVEVDGQIHQEMHVDGGATAQVFLYPASLDVNKMTAANDITRQRYLYIIRNSQLNPRSQSVIRRTLDIVGRTIESLIQTQGVGDLYRIYLLTERDGIDYNLAIIDSDFEMEHKYEFDQAYMRALFDYGYRRASNGYRWQKTPPGFASSKGQ
jgi:predicted acylesterase/phospholipase RssA